MRSLRLTAVLSAWLCLSGTTSRGVRGVDAPPPPQTETNQHNPFAGMDELITTVLDGYKNLRPEEQQGIVATLRDALEESYPSHRFATVAYDYYQVNAITNLLSPGGSSGAITGPSGCDQVGVDPPWDACRGGGSLLRFFAGSRAVDEQGLPTLVRTAVVFWWPVEEVTHVQGSIAQATHDFDQYLKSVWWNKLRNTDGQVWKACARGVQVVVDVTEMAACFTQEYASYAGLDGDSGDSGNQLPRPRGFLVAPAQANYIDIYDFSSGHIFMLDAAIRPVVPEETLEILRDHYGKRFKRLSINLLLAALL